MMMELGRVTREAILESGKKVVVLPNSYPIVTSTESNTEDMSKEHIISLNALVGHAHHRLHESGQCQRIIDEMQNLLNKP